MSSGRVAEGHGGFRPVGGLWGSQFGVVQWSKRVFNSMNAAHQPERKAEAKERSALPAKLAGHRLVIDRQQRHVAVGLVLQVPDQARLLLAQRPVDLPRLLAIALLIGGAAAILLSVTDMRGKRPIAFALVEPGLAEGARVAVDLRGD